MTTQIMQSSKYHRYELVHGDDTDSIAYRRRLGDAWQTFSTRMIPRAVRE
jgi:hypothetical protein